MSENTVIIVNSMHMNLKRDVEGIFYTELICGDKNGNQTKIITDMEQLTALSGTISRMIRKCIEKISEENDGYVIVD